MYKYILEGASSINWMAISALLTFITIFVVSAVMAFKSSPDYIDKMANMPLDDSYPVNTENDRHE